MLLGIVALAIAVLAVPAASARPAQTAAPAARVAFFSDPLVTHGLPIATALATHQTRKAVDARLATGQSLAAIATAGGSSADAVLARFGTIVDKAMANQVASGKLPQSVADARAAWFKQSAQLQIGQPGLTPRFPGLHELHVIMISSAVETSGLRRVTIVNDLRSCGNLADIVAPLGKTGADVAAEAVRRLSAIFDADVAAGKLTAAQRDSWIAALQTAATKMTTTHGLHVAGKECAAHTM
jgi:hypothetical protein